MNKKITKILLIFIATTMIISSLTTISIKPIKANDSNEKITYPKIIANIDNTKATLTVDFSPIEIEFDNNYHQINSDGCEIINEPGRPKIPAKTFNILLPANSIIRDHTLSEDTVELEGSYNLEHNPLPKYCLDKKEDNPYIIQDPYPENLFKINGIYKYKGYKILSLTFFAAKYYPETKTLIQTNQLYVEINFEQDIFSEPLFRGLDEDKESVEKMVINPSTTSTYPQQSKTLDEIYKYVIITDSALSNAFQPLKDWKETKIGSAKIVEISFIENTYTGVDTQEKIRNFIIEAHNTWTTDWILLGGDVEIVPYRGCHVKVYTGDDWVTDSNIPCDLYYSDLDGDWDADGDMIYGEVNDNVDLYADVFVGRAPVNTVSQVNNFVNKILTYEQNPPANYPTNALMIAYWMDPQTNEADLKDYISDNYLTDFTVTKEYQLEYSDPAPSKQDVMNHLNMGQGIINHASHSSHEITPPLHYLDVDSLINEDKYFIFYSIGCSTNKFEESDAISEHYILNSNGGAVAYIGNSRYGWYTSGSPGDGPSDKYDKEFFKQLFVNGYEKIGETLAMSKHSYISISGSDNSYRWLQYTINLLGDPEMNILTQDPGSESETLDLSNGWNLITIPVDSGHTAESLGQSIPGCSVVVRFDAANQTFSTHVVGIPWDNFQIENGDGYQVYVTGDTQFTVNGYPIENISIPICTGWNMIGWFQDYDISAESLGENIDGCTVICKFNAETQTYTTHVVGIPYNNFQITAGMAFFIYTTESSIWHGEG